MARIRTIKPEFWVDEKVVELSPWARLLFIGLWNFADDQGFIDYAPKRIKMQVFPGDTTDVVPLIDELLEQGMVRAYRSPIGPVLEVVNWRRHQRVDHPAKARFDPAELVSLGTPEPSRGSREALARPLGADPLPVPRIGTRDDDGNDLQNSSRVLASVPDDHSPSSPVAQSPNAERDAADSREASRTLAPEGKGKEGKGRDLTSSPPSAGADATPAKPDGAQSVVAAYIDAAVTAGHPKPGGSLPGRVGRDAKRLIAEGVPQEHLIAAAAAMGRQGWHDLAVQLQRDSAERAGSRDSNGRRSGKTAWTNYDDPDRYDKPLFRTEPTA